MFPRINCRLLANEKTDGDFADFHKINSVLNP